MHEGEPGTNGRAGGSADDPVAALEARLGLTLVDRGVALAALTHKSYVNEHREDGLQDNERLEFLGDAVIDLAVSHRLMERFPAAREGDLSKMRAAVVDEQGLADMARALDLGSLLRLGRGEELTGGRAKASLLADAMEAVIAAVYHGQGLEAVLLVIDRFLGEAFARAAAGTLDRDFKTQLQELAQSRLRVTPRYRVVAEHGPDHSKLFEVEVDLRGEVLGRGRGRSKKDSEQAAARLALDVLGRKLGADDAAAAPSCGPPEPPAATERIPEGGRDLPGNGAGEEGALGAARASPGPSAEPSPAAAGPGAPADAEQPLDAVAPGEVRHPAPAAPPAQVRHPGPAAEGLATAAPPQEPPAPRPGSVEPPGAAAAAKPRPRKRAPAAKRPARRSAPPARKTGGKQRATGAARGAARPARKGSRARR